MSLAAVKSLSPNFAAFAVKISRIKAGGFVFWQALLCPRQWARLWKTEESLSGFSPPLTTDSATLEFPDLYLLPPGLALHPVSPAALRPSKRHKLDFSFCRHLAFNIIVNYYHYPVLLAHYCWLDCEADLRLSAACRGPSSAPSQGGRSASDRTWPPLITATQWIHGCYRSAVLLRYQQWWRGGAPHRWSSICQDCFFSDWS